MPQFRARSNAQAPQRGFRQGRFERANFVAQTTPVKRRSAYRTTTRGCTGRVAMKIRNRIAIDELQGCAALEKLDHPGAVLQKCQHARFVKLRTEFVLQIGQRLVDGFDDAGLLGQRVARYPHPAARPGRGAAEVRLLFRNDDFQPQVCGCDGGRQATCARANDEQITVPAGGSGISHRYVVREPSSGHQLVLGRTPARQLPVIASHRIDQYVSKCSRPSFFSAAPTVSQFKPACAATSRSANTTPSSILFKPHT